MALNGIKVVEFAGLAPAPFCGMVLADFGASVIRIDKTGPPAQFDFLDNGKKSVSLNLKSPEGVKVVRRLIQRSDVLIEPFRAGVMEKLGLGPKVLMADNPRLVYARLTGFGQKGALAKHAGHDINFLALSGLLSLFGRKGQSPTFPVNLAADFGGGGLICALGIALALLERHKSGKGQIVDCSMTHGVAYLGSFLYRSQGSTLLWGNERGANLLDSGASCYDVYKTKDQKYMAVAAVEPQFYSQLLRQLNITEEEAPQMDYATSRALFERAFLQKTQKQWCEVFDQVDACVTPVLDLDEAPLHPHNREQGAFSGPAPNPAPQLSRTPAQSHAHLRSPKIGEHTVEVLSDLGYTGDQIQQLQSQGAVFNESKAKL
ncbi:alpha-methylacyl-CoA racemase [Dendroctonus ponderosae]|uniref:Alpha-methylacyl-CoA racemase n=1 Tax=Dendroctonus ponderosae TaxID=77166 RepID=J3JW73_DENPD